MHVGGLWSVAVLQPLFDVLGRGPEFFVAHDTGPGYLIGLVLLLGLAGPAGCLIAMRLFRRLGPQWHMIAAGGVIGVLVAATTLLAVGRAPGWSPDVSFTGAVVVGALGVGDLQKLTFSAPMSPGSLTTTGWVVPI